MPVGWTSPANENVVADDMKQGALTAPRGGGDLSSRLMRGAALALIVNVVGFGAGFLAHLAVGRALGPEGYSHYALTHAWVSFVAMVCGLGLPPALLRFVPVYREEGSWPLIRAILHFSLRRVLVISLGVSCLGLIGLNVFGDPLSPERFWTLHAGLLAMPLLAVLRVQSALLRAFGRIVSALGCDLPTREGFTFLLIAAFGLGLPVITSAPAAMLVWTFGSAVGLLISVLVWQRMARPEAWQERINPDNKLSRQWFKVALSILVIQSLNMLLRRTDLFVVDLFFDDRTSGIYAAANRIIEVMVFPTYVLNAYLAPTVAALHSQKATTELQQATTLTARMGLASALVLILPFLLAPALILDFFGPGFREAARALRILAVGEVLATAIPFATMMMTMTGHERPAVLLMGTASMLALFAMLAAGAMGSIEMIAAARSGSIILIQLGFCWLIQRKLDVSPWLLGGSVRNIR